MAKIKNNFLKATINKDFDERLTPNGQMTDASNVMVISEDNGGVGVLKNVKGNLKVTSLNIPNSETIGSIADDAKERCFYFVTSPAYDYVIQYNFLDDTTEIVLQSTHGTGVLNFDPLYRISHSDIFVSVEDDDLLSWTDGLNPPRIINIEKSKTYPIDGFTNTEISVMKPSPIFSPTVTQFQSTNVDFAGFIRDKFLTFAYRYKYEDGYFSAFSSWSPYAFIPGIFSVDLDTSTNLAMENTSRSYNIQFNTGPRSVKEVEIVFKISNSNTVYSIIKLNKEDEGFLDNSNATFLFENYKVYKVLRESDFFRSFDNVPLTALTQAKIGNRLVYGNYIEGRDIDSKIDFSVDYESTPIGSIESDQSFPLEHSEPLPELVDFWGTDVDDTIGGGAGIVMDFENQVVTISNNFGLTLSKYMRIYIDISKEPTYSNVPFTFKIYKDGVPTSYSVPAISDYSIYAFVNVEIPYGSSFEFYFEAESNLPLLFKTKVSFTLQDSPFTSFISRLSFDTDGYYQVCANTNNLVPNKRIDINLSTLSITEGSQLLFNFDLRTAFEPNLIVLPQDNLNLYTFIHDIVGSYTSVANFIATSNFLSQLNTFFQTALEDIDSNIPSAEVLSIDALVSSFNPTTNVLTLYIPNRIIEIEETGNDGVLITKTDFVLCYFVDIRFSAGTLFRSMHSARDYEVGIVFLDEQGRKTTVIDSKNNSVYVDAEDSVNQNVLKVNVTGTPPTWAKYYKFAVKSNRGKYETIFTKKIYNSDLFSYLELVGDNKNKVKDGDYLVVKSDLNGVVPDYQKVKVLEAKFYDKDEIIDGSESGFFFKVKSGSFDLILSDDDFLEFIGRKTEYKYPYYIESAKVELPLGTPLGFTAGNIVRFVSWCNRAKGDRRFSNEIDAEYLITRDYADFREVFEDLIEPSNAFQKFANEGDVLMGYKWLPEPGGRTQIAFRAMTSNDGRRNIRQQTNIYVTRSSIPVFETIPLENDDNTYIETPKTYNIINGQYQFVEHKLSDLFNCYCFGNGVESISVRDELTTNFLNIDYGLNAVSEDTYRQVNRYADLTYSGVYQEGTNVNRLNEFNLSLANFKDDLDKASGPIIKLDSDDTDILVIQEDKWSKVLYGKDLLYNTDATTNLSRIEEVLGQQVMYSGEYGISFHPDSYDDYGTNSFCTDTKRGVVLSYNQSNGITEISNSGMRDYFKTLFRDNQILSTIGQYDAFFDIYFLNIKYKIKGKNYEPLPVKYDYVTWIYSPEVNGFLGKQSFDPDSMLRVNNEFLSFKGADVYKHNVGAYNTFYGALNPSSFEFNFNEEPSTRKIFKNISIEGNLSWNTTLKTDMQNGIISSVDYINKEGVQYAYVRGNDVLDFSTLSVIGLGTVQGIAGNNYTLSEVPSSLSVGDTIHITNGDIFGTVLSIGSNSIQIDVLPGLTFTVNVGDFILASKPSNIETSGIRGYYMNCKMELNTNAYAEVFAVNSEVAKSFE